MRSREELTALREKLVQLTADVNSAIERRRLWMDDHMLDFAEYQVGDEIYNSDGLLLGIVSKLYRVLDDNMSVSYSFETNVKCFDNTSRKYDLGFRTREQIVRRFDEDWCRAMREEYDERMAQERARRAQILK